MKYAPKKKNNYAAARSMCGTNMHHCHPFGQALAHLRNMITELGPTLGMYDLVVQPNPWNTSDARTGRRRGIMCDPLASSSIGAIHVNSKRYVCFRAAHALR